MNDRLLAEEFVAIFRSEEFEGLRALFLPSLLEPLDLSAIFAGQAGTVIHRPTLAIAGDYVAYLEKRKGTLIFEIRSRLGDESASQHQARFEALHLALFGEFTGVPVDDAANLEAAKEVFRFRFLVNGLVELIEYGMAREAVVADTEGDDLRTVLTLNIVWKFTP